MVNANYAAGDAKHTDNLPKHLWFAKKYKVYPKLFVDTTKWQPLVPEPAQPPQSRGPRCLKKVVRSVILSRRIGSGFDAKIKGATLQKCKLPPETETEVKYIISEYAFSIYVTWGRFYGSLLDIYLYLNFGA